WAADRLPGVEAALKGVRLLKALLTEESRRTGAVVLMGSGSVHDREPVFRPGGLDVPVGRADADGPGDFDRARSPRLVAPHVQHRDRHTGLDASLDLVGADPELIGNRFLSCHHASPPSRG